MERVKLPDSVLVLGNKCFCECVHLNEVNIPDSVERIGDHAFYSCTNLKKISIPTNQVCVKELEHQSAIFCKQCGVCSNSIICLGCYEKSKEKHIKTR